MKFKRNFLDKYFIAYFLIHIPTTLLIDAQSFLPEQFTPFKAALLGYIEGSGDFLMQDALAPSPKKAWFQAILLAELLFQLPFFFYAIYSLAVRSTGLQKVGMCYCIKVLADVWNILFEIWFSGSEKRDLLLLTYFPFMAIALLFLVRLTVLYEVEDKVENSKKKNK